MTLEFENMLRLFGCGATGQQAKTQYCENLHKIRKLALEHEVWDIVYLSAREKIVSGEVKIPKEVFAELEKLFLSNIAVNIQKVEFNLDIVRKITASGIKCCVVKGSTVAGLYASPESRISSDTDILIDAKDESAVCQMLTEAGFSVENRAKQDHHRKTYHPKGGLLEVHVKLHSEATREFLLDNEFCYSEDYRATDNGIYSLGLQDGLMYLTAHLIKHFINDGAGVRQIMDLLLYMKEYNSDIDWEKYNGILQKLRYDTLIRTVKGVGVRFFGLDFDDAITEGEGFEDLLNDMEKSGLFGCNEKDRKQFFYFYTQYRSGNSGMEYAAYQLKNSEKSAFRMLFPKFAGMKKRYKYVEKCPVLLPFAWIHRLLSLVFKKKNVQDKKEALSDVNKRRLNMLEKLRMID